MTVSTTSNRNSATGDGSTTAFTFTFRCLSTSDIDVYLAGVLQGSGYTASINANGVGGTVTFTTAPASSVAILIVRSVDLTQATSLPTEGNLPEDTIEDVFDKQVMMSQQLSEQLGRALTLPISSTLSGLFTNSPTTSLCLPRLNSAGTGFEFVAPSTAFSESSPAAGGGNVTGSGSGATDYGIAIYNGTTGLTLRNGPTNGTSGQLLQSAGTGALPTWVTKNFLFRAANITATIRTLPTSGALSGTYIHFGDWTSTGALTFSHGTRIYLKGNMTLNHTLTGTVQSNGGASVSKYGGMPGGGNGGNGGNYVNAVSNVNGGGGGGGAGAGGSGGADVANGGVSGGFASLDFAAGGGGGGSGSGNATSLGQAGGGGGPFIYIEVDGNIADNESTTASGAAGSVAIASAGAGGGGGGGSIVKRCSGTYAIASGKTNTASGGAGGNTSTGHKGGGGGGGYIELWSGGAQTITGSNVVTGGAKGTGSSTQDATDGSAGTTNLLASTTPISLY